MMVIRVLLTILAGYLLGCCNGAIVTSKLFYHEDVRSHGSGNAGLTNFFRSYGGLKTLLVVAMDMLKAVLACAIGRWILGTDTGAMLGGLCAVLGHMFPAFFGFKGGKGILTGATVALCMDPLVFLIVIVVFVVLVALTRYVSLGSVMAAAVYPFAFMLRFWADWAVIVMAFCVAALAIVLHHANIGRLVHGTERKLSFHKKQ